MCIELEEYDEASTILDELIGMILFLLYLCR